MNRSKETTFADRQSPAATAKKAALERHHALANDPQLAERQIARQAVKIARDARIAERKAARRAAEPRGAAQKAAEEAARKAAHEAALQAEQAVREAEAAEKAARDLALEAEKQAARDARYAARKAKKPGGRDPALTGGPYHPPICRRGITRRWGSAASASRIRGNSLPR